MTELTDLIFLGFQVNCTKKAMQLVKSLLGMQKYQK